MEGGIKEERRGKRKGEIYGKKDKGRKKIGNEGRAKRGRKRI